MSESKFVYVTYIRTTPEKLWHALTDSGFNRKYWFGCHQASQWKQGAAWKLLGSDGRLYDSGEVLEIDPPRRLVLKWRNEFLPELKDDGWSRCVFEIETDGELTKLSVTHSTERPSLLIEKVSNGWPKILSSLKSLLETGQPLPRTDQPKA
ncbi:MAG TPA: SRPBCC family protein [Rhizomicrobium sp.]|jgi:uncharacterized protein YndB with AHSA1/START domain|nr:SRPBCC family protein [Rhizomicrobium sp.]